ncbi:terpene synthase family protein [Actinomadura miaoliensis]|uniref:Terpene synthase n=1 Tax=Actinomadura miaoliensis TaxID=430685 RepID=A0ABP7VWZ3_9ACTN
MMRGTGPDGGDALQDAVEAGKICALAADCQRDLQEWAASYPELFPARPFDGRLFGTVALANAFGAPWESADRLKIATRASLWVFAADWIVDYTAKTRAEVEAVTRDCMAVADPRAAAPAIPLARALADLRDELAATPAFGFHRPLWRDQLQRYLTAMSREWGWKAAGREDGAPTFEEYLDNADNFGSSLVNVSHWIYTGDSRTLDHLGELWKVSEQVQRILRLLNDLASYERDVSWGDLNALMLDVDRATVTDRITALVAECRVLLGPLRESCPRDALYLERQIGYSTGFYGLTDYWGPR